MIVVICYNSNMILIYSFNGFRNTSDPSLSSSTTYRAARGGNYREQCVTFNANINYHVDLWLSMEHDCRMKGLIFCVNSASAVVPIQVHEHSQYSSLNYMAKINKLFRLHWSKLLTFCRGAVSRGGFNREKAGLDEKESVVFNDMWSHSPSLWRDLGDEQGNCTILLSTPCDPFGPWGPWHVGASQCSWEVSLANFCSTISFQGYRSRELQGFPTQALWGLKSLLIISKWTWAIY